MHTLFEKFATRVSTISGSVWSFLGAVLLVLAWAITGPFFHFSSAWSLFINSVTTVITFWMVFIIQNAQNKQTLAMNLKLDELIRAVDKAHNELIEAEQRDMEWLERYTVEDESN